MFQTIGQRMSYLMKQKGITNIEMGELLNVDPSYIAKFKNDARRPNTYQIDKIARRLNVTTDYLLGNEAVGLPFYVDVLKANEKQGINLMSGISSEKHFSLHNIWKTISDLKKDDLLIFQKDVDIVNNKICIVSCDREQAILGRICDNMLFFDNGLPPVDISNKEKYCVIGRLIRVERYFN